MASRHRHRPAARRRHQPSAALPALSAALALSLASSQTPACPSLDPARLRLVTFDAFGALFATRDSLVRNLLEALPAGAVDDAAAGAAADDMIGSYAAYMDGGGTVFDAATAQPQPFVWVVREGLTRALKLYAAPAACGADECSPGGAAFERLAAFAWAQLEPYPDSVAALRRVARTGRAIGLLSNGDALTLGNLSQAFLPLDGGASMLLYGSDYPVGAFKPQRAVYNQLVIAPSTNIWAADAPTQRLRLNNGTTTVIADGTNAAAPRARNCSVLDPWSAPGAPPPWRPLVVRDSGGAPVAVSADPAWTQQLPVWLFTAQSGEQYSVWPPGAA